MSRRNFAGKKGVWAKWQIFEKLESCRNRTKILCKQNVYIPGAAGWGKLLWKNLWKLWKSSAFPQAKVKKPRIPQPLRMHKDLHTAGHNGFVTVLRNPKNKVTNRSVLDEKVGKTGGSHEVNEWHRGRA